MRGFVTVTSDRSGLQLHRLAQHSQWRHGACPISLFHFNFGRFWPTGKLVALSEAQVLFLDPHVHHLSAMGASATLSFLPLRDFVKVAQSHQFALGIARSRNLVSNSVFSKLTWYSQTLDPASTI